MFEADLIINQVQAPYDCWCRSGHVSPKEFRRGGPETELLLTRFFQVTSKKNSNVDGIYCEPCLIVANAISNKKKMGTK